MNKYKITFKSKDDHTFTFITEQENELDAVEAGTNSLIEKGWLQAYDYKFYRAEIIK